MSRTNSGGFALLEIVVALGLLAVSTLVIAEALGAAIEYARAAHAARRATAVAAAVAHTFDAGVAYPTGWRVAGTPGADALPGTRDDDPPAGPGPACRRRVTVFGRGDQVWLWVEGSCADPGQDARRGAAGSGGSRLGGGRLDGSAVLVRAR